MARYCISDSNFRRILYSPLKNRGFVPEKGSEIFVSRIPEKAMVLDLAYFFEQAGEVFQVKLMMQPDDVHNRGYAFVTYMNATLARKALAELKKIPFLDGNCLTLSKSVDNCRIFIGGIPITKTKQEILEGLITTYGITNIVDIISYANYVDPRLNRGFVFLEFRTHEEAAHFRAKYQGKLNLYGKTLLVDWSVPIMDAEKDVLKKVKIIFMRNLYVDLGSEEFASHIYKLAGSRQVIEKVYKFKNYAFIHLHTRENAEKLMSILERTYEGTGVEISWAKPPNKFTDQNYRTNALMKRRESIAIGTAPNTPLANILHRKQSLLWTANTSPHLSNITFDQPNPSVDHLDGIGPANYFLRDLDSRPSASSIFQIPQSSYHFGTPYIYSSLNDSQPFRSTLLQTNESRSASNFTTSKNDTVQNTTENLWKDLEEMMSELLKEGY